MNFEAADVLRQKIEAATKGFVGFNDPSLVILVPHAQVAGSEEIPPLSPGTLIVRRGPNGQMSGRALSKSVSNNRHGLQSMTSRLLYD